MSKHTQEPWKVCHWKDDRRGFEIANRNQNRVGFDMTEANARRIVACVNACAGVSNGELAMTTMSVVLARINEAEQQRDELLAGQVPAPAAAEGWQLVPMEPTERMISESIEAGRFDEDDAVFFWASMLAAAPKPEAK